MSNKHILDRSFDALEPFADKARRYHADVHDRALPDSYLVPVSLGACREAQRILDEWRPKQ